MTLPEQIPDQTTRPRPSNSTHRILQGAADRLIERGPADLTLHDVALQAGVSKALIHYHFAEKESLIVRLVQWATAGFLERQADALAGATPAGAVDHLWRWLARELELGHLRMLLGLAQYRAPRVEDAVQGSLDSRRAAMLATVRHLFALLDLRPRVPVDLLAGVVVAFGDGLATRPLGEGLADARVAFDIFWLSILSLAE